jgi:hypothetical protein
MVMAEPGDGTISGIVPDGTTIARRCPERRVMLRDRSVIQFVNIAAVILLPIRNT